MVATRAVWLTELKKARQTADKLLSAAKRIKEASQMAKQAAMLRELLQRLEVEERRREQRMRNMKKGTDILIQTIRAFGYPESVARDTALQLWQNPQYHGVLELIGSGGRAYAEDVVRVGRQLGLTKLKEVQKPVTIRTLTASEMLQEKVRHLQLGLVRAGVPASEVANVTNRAVQVVPKLGFTWKEFLKLETADQIRLLKKAKII